MASFDDVRLPIDIEVGASIGPTFDTNVISLSGGGEQRNANWDQERLTADISYGVMAKDNPNDVSDSFARIVRFFRARRGKQRAFRFRDWSDYEASEEPLALVPLQTRQFQCYKQYDTYSRKITRPVADTFVLMMNGTQVPPAGANDVPAWTLNMGVVTFASVPPAGNYQWSAEFDVPMRFDADTINVVLDWEQAGSIPTIKLIQVRE